MKSKYSVTSLRKALGLKHDTYYYKKHPRVISDELINAVELSFFGSKRAYGAEKIAAELRQNGIAVAPKTVAKIMKQCGLVSKYMLKRKKSVITTNRDPVENKLNRKFGGYKPKEVVVTDLTYVSVNQKWYYICLIVELSHREIIGFSAGKNKDSELVRDAIYSIKGNLSDIGTFHTDRGGEFKNIDIERILETFKIERSLSRPGKPIDNAVAESIYDILKTEFIFDEHFTSLENLRERLSDWVFWYNNRRLHGSLGMIPPVKSRELREIGIQQSPAPDYRKIAKNKAEKEKKDVTVTATKVNISD